MAEIDFSKLQNTTVRERELLGQIHILEFKITEIDYSTDTMEKILYANSLKMKIYILRKKILFHRNGLPEHGDTAISVSSKSIRGKIDG